MREKNSHICRLHNSQIHENEIIFKIAKKMSILWGRIFHRQFFLIPAFHGADSITM